MNKAEKLAQAGPRSKAVTPLTAKQVHKRQVELWATEVRAASIAVAAYADGSAQLTSMPQITGKPRQVAKLSMWKARATNIRALNHEGFFLSLHLPDPNTLPRPPRMGRTRFDTLTRRRWKQFMKRLYLETNLFYLIARTCTQGTITAPRRMAPNRAA